MFICRWRKTLSQKRNRVSWPFTPNKVAWPSDWTQKTDQMNVVKSPLQNFLLIAGPDQPQSSPIVMVPLGLTRLSQLSRLVSLWWEHFLQTKNRFLPQNVVVTKWQTLVCQIKPLIECFHSHSSFWFQLCTHVHTPAFRLHAFVRGTAIPFVSVRWLSCVCSV